MYLPLILSLLLALLIGLHSHAVHGEARLRYLSEPNVEWNDNRLSGEFKDVPVTGLLQELLQGRNFGCIVDGVLPGTVSIRFDNMTQEEIIRKVMRNNGYNFTLISKRSRLTDHGATGGISELVIYQEGTVVRFTRVPLSERLPEKQPSIRATMPWIANGLRTEAGHDALVNDKNLEKLDEEIKLFMERLLASGQINRQEFEQRIEEMAVNKETK